MTLLQNVKVTWSGLAGLDGFSNFYFLGGTSTAAPVAPLKVFFEAVKTFLPTNLIISYPTSGNVIEDSDGSLVGGWSGGASAVTGGAGGSSWNSAQGALVEWRGMGVVDGKRPIGKTFLIPFGVSSIGSGGLGSTTANTIQTAAAALITATTPNFVIWHRPRKRKVNNTWIVDRVGGNVQITSATCPTKMAVLTSRRD